MGRLGFTLAMVTCALGAATAARPATLPPGFSETLISGGLNAPTAMALAPDGRIFVAQQTGALRVIKNGTLLGQSFVALTVDSNGERGLLGVALDPTFDANTPAPDYVYVYYTVPGSPGPPVVPAHNRVSRFKANGDVAISGSELPILNLDDLSSTVYHNGGAIHFGPVDGKLYVAVGDNADGANSQLLTNRLGKMLRINSDGSIPPDNPYPEATGANFAIWAIGLRNPFTFAFQPGTGRMFINDVGENSWEEIDDGIARSNYGWPDSEGPTTNPDHRSPLFSYPHPGNPPPPPPPPPPPAAGCAIAGGAFYSPAAVQFPSAYIGDYFFADLCSGWIRRFDPVSGADSDFASGISNPVDLVVADDGSLYYLARGTGQVYRVTGPPTAVLAHSFRAKRSARGVVLSWRAEPNLQVLGFNVYRVERDSRVRVNRQLLWAAMQRRYLFVDRRAVRGRYWLQVVLANGAPSWVGPIAVRGYEH